MDSVIIFRIIIFVVLVIMFTISAFYRKRAREEGDVIERLEEGIAVMIIRLFFGLSFLAVLLLNIFYPSILSWDKFTLPTYFQYIGIAIAIGCVPLTWWVFRNIGKNVSETALTKEDHELIISGPYPLGSSSPVRHSTAFSFLNQHNFWRLDSTCQQPVWIDRLPPAGNSCRRETTSGCFW